MGRDRAEGFRSGPLPDVNALVKVSLMRAGEDGTPTASSVPSRIEDVLPPATAKERLQYLIAAPRFEGDVEPPRIGEACTVEWVTPLGRWMLPVRYLGRERIGDMIGVWRVEVTGEPERDQRRNFVRVPWTRPVTLEWVPPPEGRPAAGPPPEGRPAGGPPAEGKPGSAAGDEVGHPDKCGPAACTGKSCDIGEGGLLCLVPHHLSAQLPVTVRLELPTGTFVLAGRVIWSQRVPGEDGPAFRTAVQFDDPTEHGDELRPLLFAEQRRIRQAGLA